MWQRQKNNMSEVYEIRDYRPEDKSFIMATFLRGLYYGNEFFKLIPKKIFMDNYKLIIEALLNKHIIKVACLKEDPDIILGYSVLSKDFQIIHFCFVKSAWRKNGIARSLLPKYPTCVTHFTTMSLDLMKKFPDCVFNPFSI